LTTAATTNAPTTDPVGPRPYGLFGLTLSISAILVVTAILCVAGAAIAFGFADLAIGWQAATGGLRAIATDKALKQTTMVLVSLWAYVSLGVAVVAAARFRAGTRWRDMIAWTPWHPFRGTGSFWALAAAVIVYSLGADAALSRLYPPSDDWVSLPPGVLWTSLFIVLAVVFAPFAEELLFRGWLYTGLRRSIGVWPGILVTSILFALAHWENTHLYALAVFPVGVALGFVRERTGSLTASMTFHATYNAAASMLLLAR
jgi:membrane protease YdiL (CAAX protease family)